MCIKDVGSSVAVGLLCLPSLAGGIALLYNFLLHRPIEEWGLGSSVTIALAVFCGTPLAFLAMMVCGAVFFSSGISSRTKWFNIMILNVTLLAVLLLSIRFGM